MTATLRISDATMAELETFASPMFDNTAEADGPGWWTVEVSVVTHAVLQCVKLPGESDDDALRGVMARLRQGGPQ